MNPTLLWLLVGLGAVILVTWRLVVSRRRKDTPASARPSAAELALAQARQAAAPATATTPAETAAPATPAVAAAKIVAPARPRPAAASATPAGAQPAAPIAPPVTAGPPGGIERRSPGRLAADRVIAAEAARRQVELQKVQDAARAAAERRKLEAARLATTQPITPATAPALPATAATPVVALRAPGAAAPADAAPPLAPATAIPRGAETPAARAKTAGETVILVVDDSKMVRIKTSRLLAAHGYQVVTAIDGQDGISQLETCQPDLVISDVDMPVLDGFGLATHLRRTPRTAHVPIVMITSAEDRHREEALRIGVGLVMGKPYPEDELLAHIRSFSFAAQAAQEPASALA
jgi:CheY-like chemotaxis protein